MTATPATHHDVLGGEVQIGHHLLKWVDKCHALSNVQGKLESLGCVNDEIALLVQNVEEWAEGKVLCDHHQVWGTVAAPHHRQNIGVREYSGKGSSVVVKS